MLISNGLVTDMLNNVTHMKLQLTVTTLKLTPSSQILAPNLGIMHHSEDSFLLLFDRLPREKEA